MDQIIRFPQLNSITRLSRSTILRMEKAGTFPKRLQISKRSVGWRLSEVYAWLEARVAVENSPCPDALDSKFK